MSEALPSPPAGMRLRPGFTLVEILVVVAIVGILAAAGSLSLREQMIRSRLREGAQVVAREIDRARSTARTENRVTAVGFEAGAAAVRSDGRTVTLPAGVRIAAAPEGPWLVFAPPFGAAFASADAEHGSSDERFDVQTVDLAWSAAPDRRQELRIVGVLGKPVVR